MNNEKKHDLRLRNKWLGFSALGVVAGIVLMNLSPELAIGYMAGFISGVIMAKGVFMAFLMYWEQKENEASPEDKGDE